MKTFTLKKEILRALRSPEPYQLQGGQESLIRFILKPGPSASCLMACQSTVPTECLCRLTGVAIAGVRIDFPDPRN